jgi:plasmid maintenance system antidote protein VapI
MQDMTPPPHPADFLNDILMPATGRSDGEIAHLLGVSPEAFYKLLTREKPITRPTAELLGRFFRTGVDFWLLMQAEFDRYAAMRLVIERDLVTLPTSQTWTSDRLPEGEVALERVPFEERMDCATHSRF